MPTVPYTAPRYVPTAGLDSPVYRAYNIAQAATFREGDFLQLVTTGTVGATTLPAVPSGTLASAAGPLVGNLTITTPVLAGAPAQTIWVAATYTYAGPNESALGQAVPVNCAAGTIPSVAVNTAGAPATATNFALYAGTSPSNLVLQQATKVTTALGTTFQLSNPLTNSQGVNRGSTNMNANIVGIALHGSDQFYAPPGLGGIGGSFTAGLASQVLGTWVNPSALGSSPDPGQVLVYPLVNAAYFELNLAQPYNDALLNTTAGLLLDTSGYFVADNSQTNKVITIVSHPFGPAFPGVTSYLNTLGGVGDTGARVVGFLNTGAI